MRSSAPLKNVLSPLSERNKRRPPPSTQCSAAASRKVVVAGGGAAGLAAAYFAARQGAQVQLLERNQEAGKKILISGGTRCNVLPAQISVQRDYFSDSAASNELLTKIFGTWNVQACKKWLEMDIGLSLKLEQSTQKYFPISNSAQEVRDSLLQACVKSGVEVVYNASLEGLEKTKGSWTCCLKGREPVEAHSVVMATGGCSFPKLGTDGTGYSIAQDLGHTLVEPYPALVPLVGRHPAGQRFSGISLQQVTAAMRGGASEGEQVAQRGGFLFTHKGFSGPAVLDISHHVVRYYEGMKTGTASRPPELKVNWASMSKKEWEAVFSQNRTRQTLQLVQKYGQIPNRVAQAICGSVHQNCAESPVGKMPAKHKAALLRQLTESPLKFQGHEGYPKAEVTGGGIRLEDLELSTMESKIAPDMYACGEMVDVFGRIGGFNFYWAWVSGRLAGIHAAQMQQARVVGSDRESLR